MAKSVDSPYQIFSKNELPHSWEDGFLDNLKHMPAELHPQLSSAWEVASTQDFPNRKDESWRWMDYKRLDLESLQINSHTSPIHLTVRYLRENGEGEPHSDSLPSGVIVTTLRELLTSNSDLAIKLLNQHSLVKNGKFAAMASALGNDGLIVYVPQGVTIDGVLQCILEISLDNRAAFTRNIVWLEDGTNLNLEIVWVSDTNSGSGFHNGVLNVQVGERSNLHLDERQQFNLDDWNICYEVAYLGKDAQLEWNYAAIGSDTSKNFIRVELEGKGSQANLHGVMFPSAGQVINLDTRQNHWAEQTFSNLLYKSVASHEGRSIWHGMIYVDPEAKKTDAYQSNKNLVLDQTADVKSLPGLEILNDDVKCSHGATVGNIDAEEMYYLQTRGIPPREAVLLLVEGFCNQVIESFALETTRNELLDQLMKRMID